MKSTPVTHVPGQTPILASLVLAMLLPLLPLQSAHAAALAEEQTILYYLIEMQRRFKRNCGADVLPEAPSLSPSAALRSMAERSAASDLSPEDFAKANGLAGVPFLAVSLPAHSPQEAFDHINAAQCPNLMNQSYRYIGAAKNAGQWTLFMAGEEPQALPAIAEQPAPAGSPAVPAIAQPGAAPAGLPAPSQPQAGGQQPTGGQTPPQLEPEQAKGITPSVSTDPAPVAKASPTTPPRSHPSTAAQRHDPSPAPSVPVAEVLVDGAGRPVGKSVPVAPSAAPAPTQAAAPSPAPVGAGAKADPRAPADPVIVQVYEIGPNGEMRKVAPEAAPVPGSNAATGYSPSTAPAVLSPSFVSGGQSASVRESRLTAAPEPQAQSAAMLRLVNLTRSSGQFCGKNRTPAALPLRRNPVLSAIAQAQADEMAVMQYFSSTSPNGRTLGRRVSDSGYTWSAVAENIAGTAPLAENALQSWMAIEDQCGNLMSPEYVDAGVGFNAARGIWVLTLGAPARQ